MSGKNLTLEDRLERFLEALEPFHGRTEPVNRCVLPASAEVALYAQRLYEADQTTYEEIRDDGWVG